MTNFLKGPVQELKAVLAEHLPWHGARIGANEPCKHHPGLLNPCRACAAEAVIWSQNRAKGEPEAAPPYGGPYWSPNDAP